VYDLFRAVLRQTEGFQEGRLLGITVRELMKSP